MSPRRRRSGDLFKEFAAVCSRRRSNFTSPVRRFSFGKVARRLGATKLPSSDFLDRQVKAVEPELRFFLFFKFFVSRFLRILIGSVSLCKRAEPVPQFVYAPASKSSSHRDNFETEAQGRGGSVLSSRSQKLYRCTTLYRINPTSGIKIAKYLAIVRNLSRARDNGRF